MPILDLSSYGVYTENTSPFPFEVIGFLVQKTPPVVITLNGNFTPIIENYSFKHLEILQENKVDLVGKMLLLEDVISYTRNLNNTLEKLNK